MHPLLRALALAAALCASLCACPGEEKPTCGDLDTTLLKRDAPVSFSREVIPIFQLSCAFRDCHGTALTSNGLLLADPSAAKVHAAIVSVPSKRLAAMPFVQPGDPQSSFLMRKLDNTHCQLNAQCDKGDCGLSMPYNTDPLDAPTRNIVRAWIAEGAQNN